MGSGIMGLREKSIGAVVFHKKNFETKFLLLKYTAGHWDFPKGHVEPNETDEETFWREFEEETAITKKQAKILPGYTQRITYFYNRDEKTIFKEVILLLVETTTEKVIISPEHKDFAWLPFEEAMKKATFEAAKNALKKARDFLKQKNLGAVV